MHLNIFEVKRFQGLLASVRAEVGNATMVNAIFGKKILRSVLVQALQQKRATKIHKDTQDMSQTEASSDGICS